MPRQLVDCLTVLLADAPNVADWIAAAGQALGALFTAGTAGVAVWLGWRDRKWRREDQADRDAAQARLLTISTEYEHDPRIDDVLRIDVHNASDEPFYRVEVAAVVSSGNEGNRWVFDWPPWSDEGLLWVAVLHTGKGYSWPVSWIGRASQPATLQGDEMVTVTYVDSKGLRWSRTDQQAPQRVVAE